MPKNKDWKRLVRARMAKTGESYTTARMQLLRADRRETGTPHPTRPPTAVSPPDFAKRAGMRDEAVAAKTGRTWAQWVEALDAAGAPLLDHTALAKLVHTTFGIGGWWSQSVAVGYERIRGRRELHQTAKGFAVSKTRTFAVPLAALRRAFAPAALRHWFGETKVTPRKATPKVARWTEADGTHVDVQLAAKERGRSVASLQHTRLASRDDVAQRRAFWAARFEALALWLAARSKRRPRSPSTAP